MNTIITGLTCRNTYNVTGRDIVSRPMVFILLLFNCQFSFGQEAANEEVVERESMEEIIVSSPPSLRSMAAAVTKAQVNAFSIFNSLNDDSEFDVLCKKERPFKSGNNPIVNYAPVLVCRTRFVRREVARDNELFIEDSDPGLSSVDYSGHATELREKVNELTREHPELHEAMSNWVTLKTNYDKAKAEDMKSNFLARLFKSEDKNQGTSD